MCQFCRVYTVHDIYKHPGAFEEVLYCHFMVDFAKMCQFCRVLTYVMYGRLSIKVKKYGIVFILKKVLLILIEICYSLCPQKND